MKHLGSYASVIAAWDPDSFTSSHSMISNLQFKVVEWTGLHMLAQWHMPYFDNKWSQEI